MCDPSIQSISSTQASARLRSTHVDWLRKICRDRAIIEVSPPRPTQAIARRAPNSCRVFITADPNTERRVHSEFPTGIERLTHGEKSFPSWISRLRM